MSAPVSKAQFTAFIQSQVNLNWEADHLLRFTRNFHAEIENGQLTFPACSEHLHSETVLVESWAEGMSVRDVFSAIDGTAGEFKGNDEEGAWSEDMVAKKKWLAKAVFDMAIKMFLRDNYVHADLHAGNLLYHDLSLDQATATTSGAEGSSGASPGSSSSTELRGSMAKKMMETFKLTRDSAGAVQLTVVDCGLVATLPGRVEDGFGEMLRSLCIGDVNLFMEYLMEFQLNREWSGDEEELKAAIRQSMTQFVSEDKPGQAPDGSGIKVGDLMGDIFRKLSDHGIVLRGDVAASLFSIAVVEGLIKQLDPSFDIVGSSLPYFVRYNGYKSIASVLTEGPSVYRYWEGSSAPDPRSKEDPLEGATEESLVVGNPSRSRKSQYDQERREKSIAK